MRRTLIAIVSGFLLLSAARCDAQVSHKKKKKVTKSTNTDNNAAPDKILYDRAVNDIKHGRHEVGRLGLQTLINTYPDSEYLAKAKLLIADSYYKQGGTANMLQAINGYKDFGVFFPFLPEASYAQLQVAMAHYRQMAKPDRDRSEAKAAEEEFQVFLQKYGKDPLAPQAEQKLREVQEILAEGDYRIGYFYYVKGDQRAAAARLLNVARRYPLYSKSDHALWMLGHIFEKNEHKEVASVYYGTIVRNYPLSEMAGAAKDRLKAFGVPVPQPDPKWLAWQKAEVEAPRPHTALIKKPLSLVESGAGREKQVAARTGSPNLQPEEDNTSATDILSGGNRSQLGMTVSSPSGGTGGVGSTAVVETVTPGAGGTGAAPSTEGSGAVQGSSVPPEGTPASPEGPSAAGTSSSAPPAAASSSASPDAPPASSNAAAAGAPASGETSSPAAGATPPTSSSATDQTNSGGTATDAAQKPDGSSADSAQSSDSSQTDSSKDDSKKESTSKKKKGLRKIVPW